MRYSRGASANLPFPVGREVSSTMENINPRSFFVVVLARCHRRAVPLDAFSGFGDPMEPAGAGNLRSPTGDREGVPASDARS